MKNYRMIIDAEKCVGCHACEVACKQEFKAPLGFFRTMTMYLDTGSFPKVKRDFLPLMCAQCEDALCEKACDSNAIFYKNGIVHINEDKCKSGCTDCVEACSLGAIYKNPFSDIAEKCNLCSHRLDIGLQAACEATCVSNAISIITDDSLIPKVAKPFTNDEKMKVRTLHIGANPKMKKKLEVGKSFSPLNYEIYTWAD